MNQSTNYVNFRAYRLLESTLITSSKENVETLDPDTWLEKFKLRLKENIEAEGNLSKVTFSLKLKLITNVISEMADRYTFKGEYLKSIDYNAMKIFFIEMKNLESELGDK